MSRFKRIKSKTTKKSSVSINEKIASLNKELKKTGMLSEIMTTSNVYSTSTYVPAVPEVTSEVPDPDPDNGITSDDWQQPLGNDADGNAASAAPTSFPRIWTNAGYLDPTDGLLNKGDLNGDGADLPIYNPPPWAKEIPDGGIGGVQIEVGGMNPGVIAGTLSASGFTAYDPADRLGSPTFKTHPDQFKPVNYWRPFSVFHPFIDSYWPNNSLGRTPQYQGIVKGTEDNNPMVLFTAYVYIGGGRATYVSQEAEPETTINPIRRGLEDEPIYPGPIPPGLWPPLSPSAFNWLKEKADRAESANEPEIALPPAAVLAAMAALGIAFKGAESAWKMYKKYKKQIDEKIREMQKQQTASTSGDGTNVASLSRDDAMVLYQIIKGSSERGTSSPSRTSAIDQLKKHRPDILQHLSNLGYV